MSYNYDGVEYGIKQNDDSVFSFNYNHQHVEKIGHIESLYRNATILRDTYREPFDVCFSGGIDSEIVIRVMKDLGIKFNTFIFKYENNHNIQDVTNAIRTCENLNVSYKIIDFELERFYENDVFPYIEETKCAVVGRLPKLKWIEMLDNIPVFGEGEPHWCRAASTDFSKKSEWVFPLGEASHLVSTYTQHTGQVVIAEWYEYTPEIQTSFYELPYVKRLINDEIPGKDGSWSSRAFIYQEHWPDIVYIPKMVGYEGLDKPPGGIPDFMMDFQHRLLDKYSNAEYNLTEKDFMSCFKMNQ